MNVTLRIHHLISLLSYSAIAFAAVVCAQVSGQEVKTKPADAPRWTAFRQLTPKNVPEEDWDGFYGFKVTGDTTIVGERFFYPLPDPPLFAGDRIVSVRNQAVATKVELFEQLNSIPNSPISIKIERPSRGAQPRQIKLDLHRGDAELLRKELGKADQTWRPSIKTPQLSSAEPDAFGTLPPNITAEIVGYCDEIMDQDDNRLPVLMAKPVATSGTSRSQFVNRVKLLKGIGYFILVDKRSQKPGFSANLKYFGEVLYSTLRHDHWKVGEQLGLREPMVLVEEPITTSIDGKERKVSVLSLCSWDFDNEY